MRFWSSCAALWASDAPPHAVVTSTPVARTPTRKLGRRETRTFRPMSIACSLLLWTRTTTSDHVDPHAPHGPPKVVASSGKEPRAVSKDSFGLRGAKRGALEVRPFAPWSHPSRAGSLVAPQRDARTESAHRGKRRGRARLPTPVQAAPLAPIRRVDPRRHHAGRCRDRCSRSSPLTRRPQTARSIVHGPRGRSREGVRLAAAYALPTKSWCAAGTFDRPGLQG